MPTYDYRCRKCGHRFELFHSIKDETIKRCPKCKGRADRLISGGAGILFKGSGFYATDYRSSHYKEKAKQEKTAEGGKQEKTGEGGKQEKTGEGGKQEKSGGGKSHARGGSQSKRGSGGRSGGHGSE